MLDTKCISMQETHERCSWTQNIYNHEFLQKIIEKSQTFRTFSYNPVLVNKQTCYQSTFNLQLKNGIFDCVEKWKARVEKKLDISYVTYAVSLMKRITTTRLKYLGIMLSSHLIAGVATWSCCDLRIVLKIFSHMVTR